LFLPLTVILKKTKPGCEKQFSREKEAYKLLQQIQGTVIPKFYGEAIYDSPPALILSAFTGTTLLELAVGIFLKAKRQPSKQKSPKRCSP
jgi:hypothetical protein